MADQPNTVNMLDPQGVARVVPADGVSDASQAGWTPASKAIDPQGTQRWVPIAGLEDAKKSGWTPVNPDGSFTLTPKDGESFEDTMNRAANAGKSVTPELIKKQTQKGIEDAPVVAAAAPVIGAVGAAGLAVPGEIAGLGTPAYVGGKSVVEKTLDLIGKAKPYLDGLEKLGVGGGLALIIKELHDIANSKK